MIEKSFFVFGVTMLAITTTVLSLAFIFLTLFWLAGTRWARETCRRVSTKSVPLASATSARRVPVPLLAPRGDPPAI